MAPPLSQRIGALSTGPPLLAGAPSPESPGKRWILNFAMCVSFFGDGKEGIPHWSNVFAH